MQKLQGLLHLILVVGDDRDLHSWYVVFKFSDHKDIIPINISGAQLSTIRA